MTLTNIRVALLVVATALGWTLSGCNSRQPTAGSSGAASTIGSHAETTAVAEETPPAAAGTSAPDYGRCRACAHASVCACGENCMKCLYLTGGGENCAQSASYYRDACSCLRLQCPGDCPAACNR